MSQTDALFLAVSYSLLLAHAYRHVRENTHTHTQSQALKHTILLLSAEIERDCERECR